MFAAVFAILAFTAAYVAAELPSYINVCGRKNPNLSQCIKENVENVKNKICEGLTDLNIPRIEPLNIDKLVLYEINNNKIYLTDVQIIGFCNYEVDFVTANLDTLNFSIGYTFKHFSLNGTYDIDARILVPLTYKSPIYITTGDVKVKSFLQVKTTTVKDKKRLYVSEMKTNIDIKGYEANYGLKEEELDQFGQIIGSLIGNNQRDFIERLTPPLEEEVAKWLVTIFNSLFKKFSYDELFPDRP